MLPFAPGARTVIRDEEWLIRRADPATDGGWLLTCDGVSDLVRSQTALFLTSLEDSIEVLDPAQTALALDASPSAKGRSGSTPAPRIRTPDGEVREGNLGWEDLWANTSPDASDSEKSLKRNGTPKVPDGSIITGWVMDDTLPGGPRLVERSYTAPFARTHREDDCRVAWGFLTLTKTQQRSNKSRKLWTRRNCTLCQKTHSSMLKQAISWSP